MIITIGGLVGAGKTTLAKRLAEKRKMCYLSVGEIMRKMAKERGMSLNYLGRLAEKDPSIDKEIDKRQRGHAKDNCIYDSRLSAFFVDSDLKIWLTAPLQVRAERIAKRERIPIKEAIKNIEKREKCERKRYKKFYNIDLEDLSVYDLVLNTAYFTPEQIVRICDTVVQMVKSH